MAARVQFEAPDFTADAVIDGEMKSVTLSSYKGKKNVLLFFYPLDFTFVCPTEIIAFSDKIAEFEKRDTQVLGASIDSKYSHLAWITQPRSEGGLGGLKYPLVSDLTKKISTDYGVLADPGFALRGLFLIDKKGILQHMLINNAPLGRSIDEAIRMIDALTHFEQFGEVCPANWKPGSMAIKPSAAKEYFQKANAK